MKERSLMRICLGGAIAGILLMFFANQLSQPVRVNISDIHEGLNFVEVHAWVERKFISAKGTTFLEIDDGTGSINAVAFKGTPIGYVDTGNFVRILGRIQRYKGELEIIIDELEVLS